MQVLSPSPHWVEGPPNDRHHTRHRGDTQLRHRKIPMVITHDHSCVSSRMLQSGCLDLVRHHGILPQASL